MQTFSLTGEVTAQTVPALAKEIENFLISTVEKNVFLDFSAVEKADSSAVTLLLSLFRLARAKQKTFHFQGAPQMLTDLIALYGLTDLLKNESR